MSQPWVVDTNVGVVANDRVDDRPEPPHFPASIGSCVGFLREVMRSGRVAIDDTWEIIHEYQARMRSSGQPGPGDAFLKWVLVNQANPARCQPRIAEAVDGLWWKRRADFEEAGIAVNFLCPEEIKANSDRKHGPDVSE